MSDSFIKLKGTIRSSTIKKTQSLLNKKLKALEITRVAEVTGLDCIGLPVFIAYRPLAKHISSSQGKGFSQDLAWISAVMEAVEAFHLENPAPPFTHESYDALSQQHLVVDPVKFASAILTSQHLRSSSMPWIKAHNIVQNETALIPYALTCIDSTQACWEREFLSVSSNGMAAGNTTDEALCHALLEINERDDLVRWFTQDAAQRETQEIDIHSLPEGLQQLTLPVINAGLGLRLWNVSASNLFSIRCVIDDPNPYRKLSRNVGSGCHFDLEIAIARAVTEAVQDRLVFISGSRDDVMPDYYEKQQYQAIPETKGKATQRKFSDLLNKGDGIQPRSFKEAVAYIVASLIKHKKVSEIFVVDHTKKELEIPVIQAFIPELSYSYRRM